MTREHHPARAASAPLTEVPPDLEASRCAHVLAELRRQCAAYGVFTFTIAVDETALPMLEIRRVLGKLQVTGDVAFDDFYGWVPAEEAK